MLVIVDKSMGEIIGIAEKISKRYILAIFKNSCRNVASYFQRYIVPDRGGRGIEIASIHYYRIYR